MPKALLLDLSGVLYDGEALIPGARQAVERAQASDLQIRFITNTSRRTGRELLRHLLDLGFSLDGDQLFTAVDAGKRWLLQHGRRPYCLVHDHIREEFAVIDQRDPNAVFIGDAAAGFNYHNLNRAFQLCMAGAPLVAVGENRYFKSGSDLLLDTGPFVRAIEFAADCQATIVGKPNPEFFNQVLDSAGVAASDALMVGDDVFGDVEGALHAGLQAALVRTGKYRPGDEGRVDGDFHLVDSVVEAIDLALQL